MTRISFVHTVGQYCERILLACVLAFFFFLIPFSAVHATTISGSTWATSGAASAGSTGLSNVSGGTHVGSSDVPPGSAATGYITGADNTLLSIRIDGTTVPLQTENDYWVRYWVRAATNATTLGADASSATLHLMHGPVTKMTTKLYLRNDDIASGIGFVPYEYMIDGTYQGMAYVRAADVKSVMPLNEWAELTFHVHKDGKNGEYAIYYNRALVQGFTDIATVQHKAAFTADVATDVLTSTAHAMVEGEKVTLSSTTTLPAGLATGTTYYIRNPDANTYQLSLTDGGGVIDITDTGTGTHTHDNSGLEIEDLASDWNMNLDAITGITWQVSGPIESATTSTITNVPLVDTFTDATDWVTKVYPAIENSLTYGGDYWTKTAGALSVTSSVYNATGIGPFSNRYSLVGSAAETATIQTNLDIGTLPFNSTGWATLFYPMIYLPDTGELDIIVRDALNNIIYQVDIDGGYLKQGGNNEAAWTQADRYFLALHFSEDGSVYYSLCDLTADVATDQIFWSGQMSDWTPAALGRVEYVATRGSTDLELDGMAVARWIPMIGLDSLSASVVNAVTPTMATPNNVGRELFSTRDVYTAPGAMYTFRGLSMPRAFSWATLGRTGRDREHFSANVLPYMTYTRGAVVTFIDGGSINDIASINDDAGVAASLVSTLTTLLTTAVSQLLGDQNRVWMTTMIDRVQGSTYSATERAAILSFDTNIRAIAASYPAAYFSDTSTDITDPSALFDVSDDTHFDAAGNITYASYMASAIISANETPYITDLGPTASVNGSTVTDSTPSLTFVTDDGDEDSITYQIQIDLNADFSSPTVDVTSSSVALGSTTYTVTSPLVRGTYYWRVRASDGTATSEWFTANSGSAAFFLDIPSGSSVTPGANSSQEVTAARVITPNGGEHLVGGLTYNIEWNAAGSALSSIQLRASYDDGRSWVTIADEEANDGNYVWAVPNLAVTMGRIRVIGQTATGQELVLDDSDERFLISIGTAAPLPQVNTPTDFVGPVDLTTPVATVTDSRGNSLQLFEGSLFRGVELTGVYLVRNGKRYVFPTESVFFSYYDSFDQVKMIGDDQLKALDIGGRVTMAPGRMIKIQSDNHVYQVQADGTIRHIPDEATARSLYGDTWNQQITDINVTFWFDYPQGDALSR